MEPLRYRINILNFTKEQIMSSCAIIFSCADGVSKEKTSAADQESYYGAGCAAACGAGCGA
ncbi:unnamed protein product [Lupinus luteus]|uniref:Metallothionein n=1 Tax=Lupinus luteus TaxID=3873 RepID=A0AAV1XSX4_LUPLU